MFTWLEINQKNLEFNLKQFRRAIGYKTQLIPVIKSNAYGHGLKILSTFCDTNDEVSQIAVVNLEEALALRDFGIKKSILILSFFEISQLRRQSAQIIQSLAFPIYDWLTARALNQLARQKGIKIRIHLKIDVGTSRIGFLPQEIISPAAIKQIKSLKNLRLEGLFSHLAASEENQKYTKKQLAIFTGVIHALKQKGINPPLKHIACTAAALRFPQSHFNAVRLGIGLYGLWPSPQTRNSSTINLRPALSWHTRLIQIKKIPAGTSVGYGCGFKTERNTLLGIIPVGYWDGLPRALSNCGQVLFKSQKCAILGRICMNLTMIDLTGLNAKTGDKVTLIGGQGKNSITADNLAELTGTINYEIVTRLNPLLPRIWK